ncbi:hypothetical protein ACQPZF_32195 [Actinosynnema sp. CS-041913]|uniref:hypothetical protein n=1 Tax=Actinosynnema sp. CS-041913 TaxID=3239917 RepID=UPI003D91D728
MAGNLRRTSERIGLFAAAGLSILVALADLVGWLDKVAPGGTIQKITLLLLGSMALVVTLEVDGFAKLDEIDAKVDWVRRAVAQGSEQGLVAVHPSLPNEDYLRCIGQARQVTILNTWIPNLQRLKEALADALDRRAEVRILLLYPNSLVASVRDDALRARGRNNPEWSVKKGVGHNFAILEELLTEKRRRAAQLTVKVFNSLPSVAVYKADEHYYVSVFMHGQLAIESPQLEIQGGSTLLGRQFQQELDTLWDIGVEIDPLHWERDLDRKRL